jgi:uncharacterized protein
MGIVLFPVSGSQSRNAGLSLSTVQSGLMSLDHTGIFGGWTIVLSCPSRVFEFWRGWAYSGKQAIVFVREGITMMAVESRPPLPPFTLETALQKVRLAEDAWNSREPERVSLAYTSDSQWRNRSEFIVGRPEIVNFLSRKWVKELDYRLIKELWAFTENRIAVRFAYEWHDDSGNWFRSYGNENWEFNDQGLMAYRHASINDRPIPEMERLYHWPLGCRPDNHPSLSELGL